MFRRAVRVGVAVASTAITATQRFVNTPSKVSQTPLTQVPNSKVYITPECAMSFTEQVTVSRLPNGARVISQHRGSPLVAVGAYVLAGPSYDPIPCPGVGSLLHATLSRCGTKSMTSHQRQQALKRSGAVLNSFDKFKHYLGLRLETHYEQWSQPSKLDGLSLIQSNLFTALSAPDFSIDDKELDAIKYFAEHRTEMCQMYHPAAFAVHELEAVAFYKQRLGSPSLVPLNNVKAITRNMLEEHYNCYVIPSRVVIAGVNVRHADLVAAYENTPLQHSETAEHHQNAIKEMGKVYSVGTEVAQYTGGERQDHDGDQAKTFAAVGWVAFGRQHTLLKEYAACLVLQSLLDMKMRELGPNPFPTSSAGETVGAFYHPYGTVGLLGFRMAAEASDASKTIQEATAVVKQIAMEISLEDLEMAKNRAEVAFRMENLDAIQDYCDFLGTSVFEDPKSSSSISPTDIPNAIASTDIKAVKNVLDFMFSKPSSLYAHGNTHFLPSRQQLGLTV